MKVTILWLLSNQLHTTEYIYPENVIQKIIKENYDTVLTGLDDRHLSWKLEQDKFVPNFKERKIGNTYLVSLGEWCGICN